MKHDWGNFSGVGNINLYYQSWHPNDKTQAIVVIVHGLGGHSGIFNNLVQFLCDRAIAVYSFDLRGHGRSGGQRGYINNWNEFRQDLRIFLQSIVTGERDLPLFLLGQSLGGTIALDYALHYPDNLQGAILLSPALKVSISPIKSLLGQIFSRFIPRFTLDTGFDLAAGSRDPEVVAAYPLDSLRHTKGTARLATEFYQTVDWIEVNAVKLQVPLLILHGGADRVTMPQSSRRLFEIIPLTDKELREYPESYHELHNDLNYQEVFTDIENWLAKHRTVNEVH
jgi:alpha-beta hydrolase superfamily lysophospholipase